MRKKSEDLKTITVTPSMLSSSPNPGAVDLQEDRGVFTHSDDGFISFLKDSVRLGLNFSKDGKAYKHYPQNVFTQFKSKDNHSKDDIEGLKQYLLDEVGFTKDEINWLGFYSQRPMYLPSQLVIAGVALNVVLCTQDHKSRYRRHENGSLIHETEAFIGCRNYETRIHLKKLPPILTISEYNEASLEKRGPRFLNMEVPLPYLPIMFSEEAGVDYKVWYEALSNELMIFAKQEPILIPNLLLKKNGLHYYSSQVEYIQSIVKTSKEQLLEWRPKLEELHENEKQTFNDKSIAFSVSLQKPSSDRWQKNAVHLYLKEDSS